MWPLKNKSSSTVSPEQDPTSIGNLIIREGLCSQEDLSGFLSEFQNTTINKLFGKFLVSKGVLSDERLELLLLKQSSERSGEVKHAHVMRAMEIAASSQLKVADSVDRLNDIAEATLLKSGS